jgi:hypothetical protein
MGTVCAGKEEAHQKAVNKKANPSKDILDEVILLFFKLNS